MLPNIYFVASIIGSIAYALSGFSAASRKNLKFMGVFIVSLMAAKGGSAIRDMIVGKAPEVFYDYSAFLIVSGVVVFAYILKLQHKENLENTFWFDLCNSVGVIGFSITGTIVSIEAGFPIFGVMMISYISALAGGIIRDVLLNEIPAILNSDFFGTMSFALSGILYGLNHFGIWNEIIITIVFFIALSFRVVASYRQWSLDDLVRWIPLKK